MKTLKDAVEQRIASIEAKKRSMAATMDEGITKFSEAMVRRIESDYGITAELNDEEYKWEVKQLQDSKMFDLLLHVGESGLVRTESPLTIQQIVDITQPIQWFAITDPADEHIYRSIDLIEAIAYALTGERL